MTLRQPAAGKVQIHDPRQRASVANPIAAWHAYLKKDEETIVIEIRQSMKTDLVCGDHNFNCKIEALVNRKMMPAAGTPQKPITNY